GSTAAPGPSGGIVSRVDYFSCIPCPPLPLEPDWAEPDDGEPRQTTWGSKYQGSRGSPESPASDKQSGRDGGGPGYGSAPGRFEPARRSNYPRRRNPRHLDHTP